MYMKKIENYINISKQFTHVYMWNIFLTDIVNKNVNHLTTVYEFTYPFYAENPIIKPSLYNKVFLF